MMCYEKYAKIYLDDKIGLKGDIACCHWIGKEDFNNIEIFINSEYRHEDIIDRFVEITNYKASINLQNNMFIH
jgi:hypothetical protein